MKTITGNKKEKTALVIPCFNEAYRIDPQKFTDTLQYYGNLSLTFVDDGSTDDTLKVLQKIKSKFPQRVRVVTLPYNRGKGEACRQGLLAACETSCKYIGYWDADLATPLGEIVRFIEDLETYPAILVMGSRVQLLGREIRRKPMRHYAGRLFATVASFVLKIPVYDTQCGAKLFRNINELNMILNKPFISRWLFDVEILARILKIYSVSQIREIPLTAWVDVGQSKVRFSDFIHCVFDLYKISKQKKLLQ